MNDYPKVITGKDITAKDFRTWAGTVLAAMTLSELQSFDNDAQAERNLRNAIEKVSARLGNTPTICRKCYQRYLTLTWMETWSLTSSHKSRLSFGAPSKI